MPPNLRSFDQEVVGPFQAYADDAEALEGLQGAHADHQAECAEVAGDFGKHPTEGQTDRAAGGSEPGAASAAAAGGLVFG